jgi:hypothetical protein
MQQQSQPPKRKGGCLRASLIICAAFFGLFIFFIIVGISMSRHPKQQSVSPSNDPSVLPHHTDETLSAAKQRSDSSEPQAPAAAANRSPADQFLAGVAEDTRTIQQIEDRFTETRDSLKKYYATPDQLTEAKADIVELRLLEAAYSTEPASKEAKSLHEKAKSLLTPVEQQARQLYASSVEQVFINQGMDAHVTATGNDKRHLRISYPLMSRPLVYKLQNDVKIEGVARSLGFKKLIYTDGFQSSFGRTWTSDL